MKDYFSSSLSPLTKKALEDFGEIDPVEYYFAQYGKGYSY